MADHERQIEQEIARLRDELNRHNRLYYVEAAPEISDREYDRLMERLMELEAEHPGAGHARQPVPARRRRAAGRVRDASRTRCRCSRSTTRTATTRSASGTPGSARGLNPGEPVALRRRAEGRRRGRLAPLRGGRVRPGRDPRRRRAGRRHHGQPADRPRDPAGAARPPPCPARGPGRGLHDQLRARPAQRAAQGRGRAAVREPAELDRRLAQAARLRRSAASGGSGSSRTGWESPRASTRARTTRSPGS